jgi:hypothetical protein
VTSQARSQRSSRRSPTSASHRRPDDAPGVRWWPVLRRTGHHRNDYGPALGNRVDLYAFFVGKDGFEYQPSVFEGVGADGGFEDVLWQSNEAFWFL